MIQMLSSIINISTYILYIFIYKYPTLKNPSPVFIFQSLHNSLWPGTRLRSPLPSTDSERGQRCTYNTYVKSYPNIHISKAVNIWTRSQHTALVRGWSFAEHSWFVGGAWTGLGRFGITQCLPFSALVWYWWNTWAVATALYAGFCTMTVNGTFTSYALGYGADERKWISVAVDFLHSAYGSGDLLRDPPIDVLRSFMISCPFVSFHVAGWRP